MFVDKLLQRNLPFLSDNEISDNGDAGFAFLYQNTRLLTIALKRCRQRWRYY